MKKILLITACTAVLIMMVLVIGCGSPIITRTAGDITTREYTFTDFTSIEIGHAFILEVTPADTYSISITANESTFDHIDVSKTGNKLKIGMDNILFSFPRSPIAKISMPELQGLYMSGATEGNVTGFRSSQDFDLSLSGASELVTDMETGNFKCDVSGASTVTGYFKAAGSDIALSGASKIEINGSGGDIKIDASGASRSNLAKYIVNDADIDLSGGSDASLDIHGKLDVTLSGGSILEYSGDPVLGDIDISGGSELKRR